MEIKNSSVLFGKIDWKLTILHIEENTKALCIFFDYLYKMKTYDTDDAAVRSNNWANINGYRH